MTDESPRRQACPRCAAPITGDFKFCPTCAYRLRSDEGAPPAPPARVDRWPHVVLTLVLGALVVAILVVGIDLFGDRAPVTPTPGPNGQTDSHVPLTVTGGLMRLWVHVAAGPAEERPYTPDDPEASAEWLSVRVGWSRLLRYEVTRGMYLEYLQACREDPDQIPAFLRDLWRPATTIEIPTTGDPAADARAQEQAYERRLVYAEGHIDRWWIPVQRRLRERQGVDLERPPDLHAPLPARYELLLMVPPSWVSVDRWEELEWAMPAGSQDLPVTGVSWYDAVAFAAWVSEVVGEPVRLPTEVEWIRGGKGGGENSIENTYPWGDEAFRYACNCLNLWGGDDAPRLHRVDYAYSDGDGGITTDGLYAMSGNAREWTHNNRIVRVKSYLQIEDDEELESRSTEAPTLGGSFQEGIDDCTVGSESAQYLDKRLRAPHIGFRLWMQGDWMGG